MRNVLLILCVLSLTAGPGFLVGFSPLGQPVSASEAQGLMGGATGGCYSQQNPFRNICYGGNCQAGGCGCGVTCTYVAGSFALPAATPCASSWVCTSPSGLGGNCAGGP
jgi:hypothetical protein